MNSPKVLYISCHSILEYDELRMFRDLGIPFFSMGAYLKPESPSSTARPSLLNCKGVPESISAYHEMRYIDAQKNAPKPLHGKPYTAQFLDYFDVIVVMHNPELIIQNWDVFRGRNVIWRTIGQSVPRVEAMLAGCRKEGLKVIRYSPMERNIDGFIGEDALIRFGKYKEDFKPWIGDIRQVITIGQSMKKRDWFCNYETFKLATLGFPTKIYGRDNDEEEPEVRGGELKTYEDLVDVLSHNQVYFYTGTKPASYTLNFIEAAMAGIPIVSIGPRLAIFEHGDYFEVSRLMEVHGCGQWWDDVYDIRYGIQTLLNDKALREDVSVRLHNLALNLFDAEPVKQQWQQFFESL
jgi:hypothetical protein